MNISIDFTLNGVEYTISPAVVNTVIIVFVLCIIGIIIGNKVKKTDYREKPQGVVHLAEIYVKFMDDLTKTTMGKANKNFAPYMFSLFTFLIVANLSGLLGLTPPTSDYNVTLGLALITFFLIEYNAIRFNGIGNFFKGFFDPIPVLAPLNLLNEFATPISLSFRLLGNILSGTIIMGLIYGAFSGVSRLISPLITPALHAYFDVFSGLLQSYVFVMLTMVYINNAIGDREEVVEEN